MLFDIGIIGAGAVGSLIARELAGYELKICIVEKGNDVACGATKANSAIIHGAFDPVPGTLKASLNARGIGLMEKAAKELNVPYIENGSMVTAFSEKEKSGLSELVLRGRENGVPGLEILTGSDARRIEPFLSENVVAAMLCRRAAIISPYELAIAAVGNAMDNGVTFKRNFDVCEIIRGEYFTVKAKNGQQMDCKYLINCAGGGVDEIARLSGDDIFGVIPRAGEYLLLDKSEGQKARHTIFRMPDENGKGILVTPTVDGNLLTGPTASRVETCESTETTAEGLDRVRKSAKTTLPSVDFSKTITAFAGVRASVPGGDFIIRPSNKVKNLIHCAGIDSPGLTSAPAIAEYVVEILKTTPIEFRERRDFDPTRPDIHAFRKMSPKDKNDYIREHPSYGHIVCRCELISEGEIIDALKRNPPALDMDGVKRRTRSGMGRCQGGFCTPHVMHLIAAVNETPMERVTKKGKGSEILMERTVK